MTLKLHPSQWIDPHTGAISPQGWDVSMEQEEARWCWENLVDRVNTVGDDGELVYTCADSYRAARVWKSAQRRRFAKLRSCCGSCEWVAKRWSWRKWRWDYYLLGFNYGH